MIHRNSSFATLAAVAAAATAHATPLPPSNVVASSTVSKLALVDTGSNLLLDINNDGINDFSLSWNAFYPVRSVTIANTAPNYSGETTVSSVVLGSYINAAANFTTYNSFNAPETGINYFGLTFRSGDGMHYGWLAFDYAGAMSDEIGTVSAFYDTAPETGVTVAAVPEPAAGLAVAGLAGVAAVAVRKRRAKR